MSRDVAGTAMTRGLIVAFGVASSVMTARLLLPEGRGEYFWTVTLAQTLMQFASLGVQSSNTFLVAGDRSKLGALLANSVWLAVALGGAAALGCAAILRVAGGQAPAAVWIVVALTPALLLHLFMGNLLVGVGRIGAFNRVQLASNAVALGALAAAGAAGFRAEGFLAAVALAWSATAVWAVTVVAREGGLARQSMRADRGVFADGFRYAAKAYLATLCGFLVLRSSVFLLTTTAGYEQVGFFSVASQVADVMAILPQSIALVLFPALVASRAGAWERTRRQAVGTAATLGSACLLAGMLAPVWVPACFGGAYEPAVAVVRWLLPGAFFLGLTSVVSQYPASAGFPVGAVAVWGFALVLVVCLSAVLVPPFGARGAAMALSATQAMTFALMLRVATRLEHARRAVATPAFA
jgi:O-antigen/teichoic acid export membrane protein